MARATLPLQLPKFTAIFHAIIVTVLVRISAAAADTCPENPEIYVVKSYPANYTVLGNNTDSPGKGPNVIFFSEPSNVILECSSRQPILWDYGNDIKLNQHRYTRMLRTVEDVFNTTSYCFKINVFLYRQNNVTGKYTCRMLHESRNTSLFIFMQSKQKNKPNPFINAAEAKVVERPHLVNNWLQIPCIVFNPWVPVDLLTVQKTQNSSFSEQIHLDPTSLTWEPKEGFWLNMTSRSKCTHPECRFVCRATGNYSGTDTVRILPAEKSGRDPEITIEFQGADIICNVPSGMYLKELVFKKCHNFMECYNAGKTPSLPSDFQDTSVRDCDADAVGPSTCKQLTPPALTENKIITGVVRCTAGENRTSELSSRLLYRFFQLPVGLAVHRTFEDMLKIYTTDSRKIKSSVLEIDGNTAPMYVGESVSIQCSASPFVIPEGIEWLFIMANGSQVGKKQIDFQTKFELDIRRPNFKMMSFITFTAWSVDIKSVVCLGPTLTGHNWINDTTEIKVLRGERPTFAKIKSVDLKKTFHVDEENASISCTASGDPKPTITWEKDGKALPPGVIAKDVNQATENLSSRSQTQTNALTFTVATEPMKGEYTCIAHNFAGSTRSQTFVVDFKGSQGALIGTIAGAVIAILILTAIVVFLYRNLVLQKKIIAQFLSDKEVDEFFYGMPEMVKNKDNLTSEYSQFLPYQKEYEITPENIKIESEVVLGSGQYGVVFLGKLAIDDKDNCVAVKTVKPSADKEYVKALLSEIKIMMTIGTHPSIVNFIGALTQDLRDGKLLIVVEFCSNGSLEKYLRKYRTNFVDQIKDDSIVIPSDVGDRTTYINFDERPLDTKTLVTWAYEIAAGMEHLAMKKVIHADLACRNVLVMDNRTVKITDFGLSRQLYESSDYVKKTQVPLPWRWMAVESLKDMSFSVQSDIWSYAVTLWEIFTLGAVPYPGYNWDQDFLKKLETGLRVDKPELATSQIYSTMLRCMETEPESRLSFTEVKKIFQTLVTTCNPQKYNSNYAEI